MARRIFKLLTVSLVAGLLIGGAYGTARRFGGEADCAPEVVSVAPTVPAVSAVLAVIAIPTPSPLPTIEPTPEPIVEAAAAPEDVDAEPLAFTTDVSPSSPPPPPPPRPTKSPDVLEGELFAAVNAQRAAAGLPPLQLDSGLATVARERSTDMAQRVYFSHYSPNGETAITLIGRRGISCPYAGENIAYNNYSDDETVAVVLSSWMASQDHRSNILSPHFDWMGVGVAVSGAGMRYFTVVFCGS